MTFLKTLLTATLLTVLSFGSVQAKSLSVNEIQNCWKATMNLSGTFRMRDERTGEIESGTFMIQDSTELVMLYQSTGARLTFTSMGILQEDMKSNTRHGDVFHKDRRLRFIFSDEPDIRGLVSAKGSNANHTLIRFDSDGDVTQSLSLYFGNSSCRLEFLAVDSPQAETLTEFLYR